MVQGPSRYASRVENSQTSTGMKRKTRDCVRTAPTDVLVPRVMWNNWNFWNAWNLRFSLARNALNEAQRLNDWNGLIPVMNGA
jgi:hypothetical protein